MRFHRIQHKRAQISIIPMIDILLIMVLFLVVTTTFKKPRNVLRIELPTVHEVPSGTLADSRFTLTVDALGKITLDQLPVPEGLLESYLVAFKKQNPDGKLELEADRKLPLEHLLKIWDALAKAGIPLKDVPARIKLPNEDATP